MWEFNMSSKKCTKCKKDKKFSEFSKKKSTKDGLQPSCKECQKRYTNDYNNKNREQVRRKNRERYHSDKFKEKRENYNKTPHARFLRYKNVAKNSGRDFEFTEEEFIDSFWKKDCSYCGSSIETVGVDRIDSSKGYTKDNSTPCCETCNRMKMALDYNFWVDHMRKIISNLKGEDYV